MFYLLHIVVYRKTENNISTFYKHGCLKFTLEIYSEVIMVMYDSFTCNTLIIRNLIQNSIDSVSHLNNSNDSTALNVTGSKYVN